MSPRYSMAHGFYPLGPYWGRSEAWWDKEAKMAELRGGIGGYGGITTMNQDQRQGRYAPHRAVSRFKDPMTRIVKVTCYICDQEWAHPDGTVQNVPAECRKN